MSSTSQATQSGKQKRLPLWLWAVLPLAVTPIQVLTKALSEDVYRVTMRGELGLIENLTVLSLLVSIVLALKLYRLRHSVASRLFTPFCVAMAAGCFFFAGEEASWGQHWFGYEVPETIAERNDQQEFNLHNDPLFEKLLDQPPRAALTLFALLGVIVPLVRRRQGREIPRFDSPGWKGMLDWIWPTIECLPAGLIVATVTWPKKIFEATLGETPDLFDIAPGEIKELCLGLFLMIYMLVMLRELRTAMELKRSEASSF